MSQFKYLGWRSGEKCFQSALIFYNGSHFVAHSFYKNEMSPLVNISHKKTGFLIDRAVTPEQATSLVDQYDQVFNNCYTDYGSYFDSWYKQAIDLKRKLLPVKIRSMTDFKKFSQNYP
jgi:hypothetical protein